MFWYIFFTRPVENIIWWFVEKRCNCVLIPDKLTEKICVVPNRFLFYEGFPEAEITRVWSLPSSLIMLHSRHQGWRKLKLKWLSGTSDIKDTGRNSNAWHTRPRSKLLLKWIFLHFPLIFPMHCILPKPVENNAWWYKDWRENPSDSNLVLSKSTPLLDLCWNGSLCLWSCVIADLCSISGAASMDEKWKEIDKAETR